MGNLNSRCFISHTIPPSVQFPGLLCCRNHALPCDHVMRQPYENLKLFPLEHSKARRRIFNDSLYRYNFAQMLIYQLRSLAFWSTAVISGCNALKLPGHSCKVLFDGRVPLSMQPADFDKNSSIYDHQFVHGESVSF